ncbi:MAG: hypothetical protein QOI81_1480 [Actinomycetota bacterium]|jgi:uncharacterized membrane-anchored protein|nr:hypothetical protein [Actinomycetota bacterium]
MRLRSRTHNKVPEVTIYFWIVKVLTTGMGETTSDFFIHRVGLTNKSGLAAVGLTAGVVLLICLVIQVRSSRYSAPMYWMTVVMVGVFGTMVADGVHAELGVPYLASSVFFAVALAVVFVWWNRSEKTLSIHSIHTRRRELFYWAAVLTTFSLGTATGDMTAFSLKLGFLSSGLLFACLFALPAIAYWKFHLNAVFAFWFAYIVTRPLGASFADWFAGPARLGSQSIRGLGFGYGVVSLILGAAIICLVAYLDITRKDVR